MQSSVLEVLYATQASLKDPDQEFVFSFWPSCTCGHLYMNATGHKAQDMKEVVPFGVNMSGLYASVIIKTAQALGFKSNSSREAIFYISDLTRDMAQKDVGRKHALQVIDRAIEVIESHEREAALQVAQTAHDRALIA